MNIARTLIWGGILMVFLGILFALGGKLWNQIPGNVEIRGKNWTFYFPIGLCLLISIVGSLLLWLFGKR
jgi:Protein of unknown function (DUF2905)